MTPTPHDALFKATFGQPEHAAAALRRALPAALADRIDFASLALRSGSFVDEELAASHSDLLFSARLDESSLFVYLLFEHQSTTHPLMAFRLLKYMMRIWQGYLERHPTAKLLPAIVPVVLHHSEHGWTGAVTFQALLDLPPDVLASMAEHLPQFRFALDDISAETDEALRARAMTALGRLVLWCFRHARDPEELVARLSGWFEVVREVRRTPGGGAALSRVWRYILTIADPARPEQLLQRLLVAAGPETKEEIVTIADYLREEGRKEGHRDGQRSTLLKQLRLRFGELPESSAAAIRAADARQIEVWTERVLTAPTLADVLTER